MSLLENNFSKSDSNLNFENEDDEDDDDNYKISDDFKLLSILGEGMFGKVYCAYSFIEKKNVALKVIKKIAFTQEKLDLLRYEESIVSQLDHINIIHFYMVKLCYHYNDEFFFLLSSQRKHQNLLSWHWNWLKVKI